MTSPQVRISLKRWYRSKKDLCIVIVLICVICFLYYALYWNVDVGADYEESEHGTFKIILEDSLFEDKDIGCDLPSLDPFSKEIMAFDKDLPKVQCPGRDWVSCWLSECRIIPDVLTSYSDIKCTYQDIIYESDAKYILGPPATVFGAEMYVLTKSDHAKVNCEGFDQNKSQDQDSISLMNTTWFGHVTGFRITANPDQITVDGVNVLILAFDSTSKNGFIRRMPKSYRVLKEELDAAILNGYNIVGDATPAALFPILTGRTELELPTARKGMNRSGYCDEFPFIFYRLKEEGYRTAYFEDAPYIGTFQFRFNGFRHQPADHYLRAFFQEESKYNKTNYCVGAKPQFQLMLNVTDQFLRLQGKKFCFTFISDISHDDFNLITSADEAVADFLRFFKSQGWHKNTLLVVMGDHGPRYENVRSTYQGMLEERLPLMSIVLPRSLISMQPQVEAALLSNTDKLTTPHDLHATLLDAMNLRRYWNKYTVTGEKLKRGLSMLKEIPRSRTCSEAGIKPYWCTCIKWDPVSDTHPLYARVAHALLDHVNNVTSPFRTQCALRILSSIMRVRRVIGTRPYKNRNNKHQGDLGPIEMYSVKISVGPGTAVYEALVTYLKYSNTLIVDTQNVQRTNAYGVESACIRAKSPHLTMYCYCNKR